MAAIFCRFRISWHKFETGSCARAVIAGLAIIVFDTSITVCVDCVVLEAELNGADQRTLLEGVFDVAVAIGAYVTGGQDAEASNLSIRRSKVFHRCGFWFFNVRPVLSVGMVPCEPNPT